MRVDQSRLHDAEIIDITRCEALCDKRMAITRRTRALLAAAGEAEPHRRWYVLMVASRLEQAVENRLGLARIEAWVPTAEVVLRRRAGRKDGPKEPVTKIAWPGYVFVKVANTAEAWAGLATVKGVLGVVGTADHPHPIADKEINELKCWLEEDEEAREALVDGLKYGDTVRVTRGPFASFQGLILWLSDKSRLGVEVNIFGRSCETELDLVDIEKVR